MGIREVLQFPPDKGLEKWHRRRRAFSRHRPHRDCGVGHRAQREVLPRPARHACGRRERELRNRAGAPEQRVWRHLRITALRGEAGPGLNCWSTLAPRDGRPFPSDEQANDIVHRQTVVESWPRRRRGSSSKGRRANFVSSGVVANQTGQLGFSKAFLVRDPDGHAVQLMRR